MKMTFKNIAYQLSTNRYKTDFSQADFAVKLGYRNGQFISNIERGLCNLPPHLIVKASEILQINPERMIDAMVKDYADSLNQEVKLQLPFYTLSERISPYGII